MGPRCAARWRERTSAAFGSSKDRVKPPDDYPAPEDDADPEFEAALAGAYGTWKDRDAAPDTSHGTADAPRFPLSPAAMAAFGSWKHKNIDAVEYVRALRAEWDRPWDPD